MASGIHIIACFDRFKLVHSQPRAIEQFAVVFRSTTAGYSGIVLGMCSANERPRNIEMSPLVDWAHTQNDPWQLDTRHIIIGIDAPHSIMIFYSVWYKVDHIGKPGSSCLNYMYTGNLCTQHILLTKSGLKHTCASNLAVRDINPEYMDKLAVDKWWWSQLWDTPTD